MTEPPTAHHPEPAPWTCPFCPLNCDHFGLRAEGDTLVLQGGDCARASRALAAAGARPSAATPELDGQPCDRAQAIAAAAALLRTSRQPLFGGLGTDVAGARALYRLASASGAICDSFGGPALMQGLRVLQDRGQYTTTLAEVRTRADLIVFVGGLPLDVAPLAALRLGIGDPQVAQRQIVVLGASADDEARLATWAAPGVQVLAPRLPGDLFDTLAQLAAQLGPAAPAAVPAPLQDLARALGAARYAVIVGAPPRLPAHGALLIEAVNRIVTLLNRHTRASALWLGGGNGAGTVNQVFTWLSGLPLRSRAGPLGLEHEPLAFDSTRLLADGAVDAVLWLSSFEAEPAPPAHALPMVVVGHPGLAAHGRRAGARTVFIPVATPGIGAAGHVFRTDGTVLMPLDAARAETLPGAAEVLSAIADALAAGSAP